MKKALLLLLIASPAFAAGDDALWQQLVGSNEARCAQQLVDSVREISKLRAQIDELQKQATAAKPKG